MNVLSKYAAACALLGLTSAQAANITGYSRDATRSFLSGRRLATKRAWAALRQYAKDTGRANFVQAQQMFAEATNLLKSNSSS